MRIVMLVGTVAILTACDNLGPIQPPPLKPYSVVVTTETRYSGTIADAVEGTGSIDVLLSSGGDSSVGGTWNEAFTGKTITRFISGTLNGSSYGATVSDCYEGSSQPCASTCRLTFTGTLTSNALSGSYAELPGDSCATARSGSINAATKQ